MLLWFSTTLVLIYQISELGGFLDTATSDTLEHYRKELYKKSKGNLGREYTKLGFYEGNPVGRPNTVGFCTFSLSQVSFIIGIKRSFWQWAPHRERLLVLAHEYGHCDCKMFWHTEKFLKDGCPAHFMYKQVPETRCLDRHWEMYERQFATPCTRLRRHR